MVSHSRIIEVMSLVVENLGPIDAGMKIEQGLKTFVQPGRPQHPLKIETTQPLRDGSREDIHAPIIRGPDEALGNNRQPLTDENHPLG